MVQPRYLTVREYAAAVRLTRQAVALACREGRIEGAVKAAGTSRWLIPRTALPPLEREPARGEPAADRRKRARAALDFLESVR